MQTGVHIEGTAAFATKKQVAAVSKALQDLIRTAFECHLDQGTTVQLIQAFTREVSSPGVTDVTVEGATVTDKTREVNLLPRITRVNEPSDVFATGGLLHTTIAPLCTAVLYLSEHAAVRCSRTEHPPSEQHSITIRWDGETGHLPLIRFQA